MIIRSFFSIIVLFALLSVTLLVGCRSNDLFKAKGKPPCWEKSTKSHFHATGIHTGSSRVMGEVQHLALMNAQTMIISMMEYAFDGFIETYTDRVGSVQGNIMEAETRAIGRQTIIQLVNITDPTCQKWSKIDKKGEITCFYGIKISKEKVTQVFYENMSKSQQQGIRERAAEARKELDEYLKQRIN